MKNYLILLVLITLIAATKTIAQAPEMWYEMNTANTLKLKEGAKSPRAKIADLDWYVGRWVGQGFGGDLEENMGPAMGNSMIGSFRMVQDGIPIFYEFIAIIEENGTLAYKVKHFNPDMTGWETKDEFMTFPLIKMGEQAVWFDGLTIQREGDKAILHLALEEEGAISEHQLVMELAK
ncbi:MAG: DUF6265 family protein [Bacteroidota bacterium]